MGRTCGVPWNFDLYGAGKINVLAMQAKGQRDRHKHGNTCWRGDVDVKVDYPKGIVFSAEMEKWAEEVEKWVIDSVERNATIEGRRIQWKDVIPKKVGDFLLVHCADLTWSVRKTFACDGYEGVFGEVKFRGLTFEGVDLVAGEGSRRRRRLLQHRNGGC